MTGILAAGTTPTTVQFSDFTDVLSAVTAQFSVANIVQILAGLVATGIGFVFLWWGVRKAYGYLMKATRKGKGSV